jgi:sRNA-binding regulator protein Hfq
LPFTIEIDLLEDVVKSYLNDEKFKLSTYFLEGNDLRGVIVSWSENVLKFEWTSGQFIKLGAAIFTD